MGSGKGLLLGFECGGEVHAVGLSRFERYSQNECQNIYELGFKYKV